MTTKFLASVATALMMAAISSQAHAVSLIPYAKPGAYNAATYSFTAANTGDVFAYFTGASAAYDSQVGLLVNGVSTGVYGLDDHGSAIGDSINLGSVQAGDSLVFVLDILTLNKKVYSDPSLNLSYDKGGSGGLHNGHNHIYSTAYDATSPLFAGVPTGTFVSFEDQRFPRSDLDYNDYSFVFTNPPALIASRPLDPPGVAGVPEPGIWALMIAGIGMLGLQLRRRRAAAPALTALA